MHSARSSARLFGAGLLLLVLVAAGCGDDATDTTGTTDPGGPGATTPSDTADDGTTVTATARPDDELPGEDFARTPDAGVVLAVVGRAHDHGLEVRDAPDDDGSILFRLDPTAADFESAGRGRRIDNSIWFEVVAKGSYGWVRSAFVAQLGPTTDRTAQIIDDLGATPESDTMEDLGLVVAEAIPAGDDPRIVMSVAPSVGDLGEVTYDVIGLADDSVRGLRLHVFGTPNDGSEGFVLKSVESTDLCDAFRGVASDGLCA